MCQLKTFQQFPCFPDLNRCRRLLVVLVIQALVKSKMATNISFLIARKGYLLKCLTSPVTATINPAPLNRNMSLT